MENINIGDKFNSYTYLGRDKNFYLFKCTCGEIRNYKHYSSVVSGRIKSCGCQRFKSRIDFFDGKVFGFLTLNGKSERKGSNLHYECVCRCGKNTIVRGDSLKDGHIKSCGCRKVILLKEKSTTHGLASKNNMHPLYSIWRAMRSRCRSKSPLIAKYYYDKNIKVCEEWEDFLVFYNWALSHGWEKGLTIDRENNNGNYEPNNCRWVTMARQNRNKENNIMVTAFGETKCLSDWVIDGRCKVTRGGLQVRIFKLGWPIEKAIVTERMNNGYVKKIA